MPKISIFTPVFNAQNYLEECLNSLRNQTFSDWECLLIDDGSTDKSKQIIDAFTSSDSRFIAFFLEHCGNPQKLKGLVRPEANGDWFFDLDADDFLEVDCLEILVNRQKQTGVDTVILQLKLVDEQGVKILKKIPEDNFNFDQILSGKEAGMLTIGKWGISTMGIVSRDLYTSANFDLSNNSLNLDEYVSQATLFASRSVAFSQAGYFYRQHQQARTKTPTPVRFAILHSDKMRENLVISHFGEHSNEAKIAKTTSLKRFLGMYTLFFRFQKHFSKDEQKRINTLFLETFKSFSKKEIWHSNLHVLKKCLLILPRPFVALGCKFYAFLRKMRP
ncbi:MAG: glycosyltransferase [Bacteroidales bacterium]|nr:glycosyltransferase [Bacteroidales bacterium]